MESKFEDFNQMNEKLEGYALADVPPQPLQVVLDETGTTIDLDSKMPEGATLVLDSKIAEALPTIAPQDQAPENMPKVKLTRNKLLTLLREMLSNEQISQRQVVEMRRKFGISNSSFKATKVDKKKKKKARKLAKAKRRINKLKNAAKGQKRNNGRTG